ncbi:hypothetical protein ACFL6I_29055, partial [candidate division KSB1 bacterium]
GECPMKCLINTDRYNIDQSNFWGVIKKYVIEEFGRNEDDYTDIIAWSNLFKIAPFIRGDLEGISWNEQYIGNTKLFKQELDDLKPQKVLIITDLLEWALYFLHEAGIDFELCRDCQDVVKATSQYGKSMILIASQPESKGWDNFKGKIAEYFRK